MVVLRCGAFVFFFLSALLQSVVDGREWPYRVDLAVPSVRVRQSFHERSLSLSLSLSHAHTHRHTLARAHARILAPPPIVDRSSCRACDWFLFGVMFPGVWTVQPERTCGPSGPLHAVLRFGRCSRPPDS